MAKLDPIVSLSVGIAEAPGSYAFLLGSGVSRDADVPTGEQVLWETVAELYRVEARDAHTPPRDELAVWLKDTGRAALGYSDVLALIAPDQAGRRNHLARLFEGRKPARTHERLAELTARGLVTVFVTTNFDRLLESALAERGIQPVVISTDQALSESVRREHAACYILKPHGDYLQDTIRNTRAELASLSSGIASELQEILNRYGIVVLGYSGKDEAIAGALRARHSRYGLYWVSRSEPATPARALIEETGGRLIIRPGAAEFLADLEQRLAVFEAQPSGLTPIEVHDEVVLLLRRDDSVGLDGLLRRERVEFAERLDALDVSSREQHGGVGVHSAPTVHRQLLPVLERRLAGLLPLVLHDRERFAAEVDWLIELKSRQVPWEHELFSWSLWWLCYALGMFAASQRRFVALAPLLDGQCQTPYGEIVPLADPSPQDGRVIPDGVMKGTWYDPPSKLLLADLQELPLLKGRYPPLCQRPARRSPSRNQ